MMTLEIGSCARRGLTNYLTNDVPAMSGSSSNLAWRGQSHFTFEWSVCVLGVKKNSTTWLSREWVSTFCVRSVADVGVVVGIGCYWFVMDICAVRSSLLFEMPMRFLVPHTQERIP